MRKSAVLQVAANTVAPPGENYVYQSQRSVPVSSISTPITGWHFFPLPRPPELGTGKRPLTTNGYKDATSSRRAIRKWFADLPHANVAVATGEFENSAVLDVDPRHGGAETLARLEEKLGPLPNTWRSHTSRGGKHLFFQWPPG